MRIFNTYGPRMRLDDGRVVPNFMGQALRGEPLTVYGDGSQTRSFRYVVDLVEGIVRLLDRPHGPVNIGNPKEMTILQFAEVILKLTGSQSRSCSSRFRRTIRRCGSPTLTSPGAFSAGNPKCAWKMGSRRPSPISRTGSPPCPHEVPQGGDASRHHAGRLRGMLHKTKV